MSTVQKSVTIHEVASRADVSLKTVSRVINNEPSVHPKTRARVLEIISELDYRPNLNARGLAGDRSFLIGLFCGAPGDYVSEFQIGAVERCRESGYHLMVEPWDTNSPAIAEQINKFLGQIRLDGVILLPPLGDNPIILEKLQAAGVPIIRISPMTPLASSPSVGIDDYRAARDMTAHLLSLGHRRIGFILGRGDHGTTEQRRRGFVDELLARGVKADPALFVPGNFEYPDGLIAAERLLNLDQPPTAIFASNDDTAVAAMTVARKRGMSLPDDLSVAGFDDVPIASMVWPMLTSVRQPVIAMAKFAVNLIIENSPRRNGWPTPIPHHLLDFELVIRGSTTAPAAR